MHYGTTTRRLHFLIFSYTVEYLHFPKGHITFFTI